METQVQTEAAPPASHSDAARLLNRYGEACERVISVDRDSILYVTPTEHPRTMWVYRQPGGSRLIVRAVPGFAAEPPEDWPPGASATSS